MQTKWMMRSSAAGMAGLGLAATFLPQEIAVQFGEDPHGLAILLLQIVGGLYLGFAMLNWLTRDMAIGGIYNRPLLVGNLLHFIVVGLALAKAVASGERRAGFVALALFYGLFAVWFGRALFRSPTPSAGAHLPAAPGPITRD